MELLNKDETKIKKINAFMQEISQDLPKGKKREVYEMYESSIKAIRPIDLFYVEQYRHDSSLSVEAIKENANKFVNVFFEGLKNHEMQSHDHPFFQSLLDENNAIIAHLDDMKQYFKAGPLTENQQALIKGFEKCLEFEKKYVKKENILFPKIEGKIPSNKPLEVMWSLHDDARKLLKDIIETLRDLSDEKKTNQQIGKYYYLVYGIIQKEQLILFPVANMVLDHKTMDSMYEECFDFGFTFIEKTRPKFNDQIKEPQGNDVKFLSRSGELTFKQIALIFNHLPVDITYVDKHDRVKYFNERKARHFPRNPSIIGRLVKHCHPPKSVDTVERIIEAFKSGEKDTAEFHINFKGQFLHIRYFAVMDESNHYEGVLEVSQDITDIQKLKGDKRLLDWE